MSKMFNETTKIQNSYLNFNLLDLDILHFAMLGVSGLKEPLRLLDVPLDHSPPPNWHLNFLFFSEKTANCSP